MQAEPLTMEELAAIAELIKKEEHERQCSGLWEAVNRLLAAADRSIRRPIETAPTDGTLIDVWDKEGNRYPDCNYENGWWIYDSGRHAPLPNEPITWLPIPGEGGV